MKYSPLRTLLALVAWASLIAVWAPPVAAQTLDLEHLKGLKIRNIGPAAMSGRVTAIDVVEEQPETIYIGTASGGLWKSESGGITWAPIFDEQPTASIGAIAIYQKNPDILYVGTGEGNPRNSQNMGNGVYRSLDGGKTWTHLGLENTRTIHRIFVHPDDPNTVVLGAHGNAWGDTPERGVYKTTDGGKTWRKTLFVNNRTGVGDMAVDPTNPYKFIVNMYEYRRWPWLFQSGGEGSGLYVSYDGGETWKQKTEEDGLPKGQLGRMGLAIAPSNPKTVYALIEAKKNGLYKSTDGGEKWALVQDKDIGDRPFYYADLFVDPDNEHLLYNVFSNVKVSIDGGKTFETLLGWDRVHGDHHAWYIHPKNSNFIIDGNDGGLAISRDRGKTWRFIDNLPLSQFYHISVDMATPYRVLGGMQDNGSWRGPSQSLRSEGILNYYWDEVAFGDGFDVLADPEDDRYGYAMWQGGNLQHIDFKTGHRQYIKPTHAGEEFLRFHWNAAIAQDPFDPATIYYGSQFVHRSTDRGQNWTAISPDLTTNDPDKQRQLESGGLTFDVTGAENHCTILAIAPSKLEQGLIWVGTDDGQLQLTRDGGKTWANLSGALKGMPKGAWVPQVQASEHQAGEALVVVNDYRRNDWSPMLFHTTDYGKTWRNLAAGKGINSFVLCAVQDPVEPSLLFLGADDGLYVSMDYGKQWAKWGKGFPTVPVQDMVIHPREHDLVIGTFGRAAWILDDIRPLRALAAEGTKLLDAPLRAYPAPDAYMFAKKAAAGAHFFADAMFKGEDRPEGALITYSVKATPKQDSLIKSDTVYVSIFDERGKLIRELTTKPEQPGMNRMAWGLDQAGFRSPNTPKPKPGSAQPGGIPAGPGTYTVKLVYAGQEDSTTVTVKPDPRMAFNPAHYAENIARMQRLQAITERATAAMDQLDDAKASLERIKGMIEDSGLDNKKALTEEAKAMDKQVTALQETVRPKKDVQGIFRDPQLAGSLLGSARGYFNAYNQPNGNQMRVLDQAEAAAQAALQSIEAFLEKEWADYRLKIEALSLSPFKG